ncbi:SCO family protein [Myroides sp. JBRI-B21084]|uniref:SCO family protein n=1 Tax=Myroides sp. JBRI-B21084 TaxID=3119977 RepID=UPI0026E2B986|nr:SCO family protein [Paenimyroides cloacae]WKW46521.1 SCO family protein [Paenimyroides cloacae]
MKKFLLATVLTFALFTSCKNDKATDLKSDVSEKNSKISDMSIYNLPSKWTNQNNHQLELKDLKGNVLVMVMIYTTCKSACPRLVADMRHIEQQVKPVDGKSVKYVLVSIDPETDTPERLKAFAKENKMDGDQWVFLRSTEENTREFAATLAVNYKKISPIDFSHSNIISVFNTQGELTYQQEGLGIDYAPTIAEIKKQLSITN